MQPWVESTVNATGHALGVDADVPWLKVTPVALRGVLNWITNRYGPVELKVRQTHPLACSHSATAGSLSHLAASSALHHLGRAMLSHMFAQLPSSKHPWP
jgi:hypothetical protein